ncbi:MAG: GNAT family N-acetyltransferase [Candidatus Dormibacteraeota bacterium]|uniref:GNAT family N-acetyltransferase n=1 Tax=Candidatus Amunia macphersoniae TaxID=3127014 RepID=A0A934NE06_9BACT|nr:GNAT family N-acetyltransferase [Candidatus Dormibacteraeota bacterium]
MLLAGQRVVLRRANLADVPRLAAIIESPEVSQWWGTPFTERDLEGEEVVFAVEVGGDDVAGLIQYYEENEPDYRSAGIDIALAPEQHGRGHGPDALRTLARYLFEQRGHHRLTIDPAAANTRAIAAYSKVGFKPVGVMRRYERGRDGNWHDGLLMDMLHEELC